MRRFRRHSQRNAIRDVDRYTVAQDKALAKALLYIRKLQVFKAADLAGLAQTAADLAQVDVSQRLAKKAQVNATAARDNSVKELLKATQTVRAAARAGANGRDLLIDRNTTIT